MRLDKYTKAFIKECKKQKVPIEIHQETLTSTFTQIICAACAIIAAVTAIVMAAICG